MTSINFYCQTFYIPPGLTFKVLHGAYIAFICFVKISEQIAFFGLYNINGLFHVSEVESLLHSELSLYVKQTCFVFKGSVFI